MRAEQEVSQMIRISVNDLLWLLAQLKQQPRGEMGWSHQDGTLQGTSRKEAPDRWSLHSILPHLLQGEENELEGTQFQ